MKLRLYHHRDGARIAYREAGVGLLLLQCSPQLEEMERFAELVMPLVDCA